MPLLYFEVFCADCGKGLCKLTTVDESNGVKLEVKPCPECLKAAESNGFARGLNTSIKTALSVSPAEGTAHKK